MNAALLFHPATTFVVGIIVAIGTTGLLLNSCAAPRDSAKNVADYRAGLSQAGDHGPAPGGAEEKAALARFTGLLQHIDDQDYVRKHTAETYAADAYFNDTLVTRRGSAAIEAYFLKTSAAMTAYQVDIDDIARSGPDYYVRWTMTVAAPALDKGKPVQSIGISQVRLDADGRVMLHQDFWDAGGNFYGELPVARGVISVIRKRLEKQ